MSKTTINGLPITILNGPSPDDVHVTGSYVAKVGDKVLARFTREQFYDPDLKTSWFRGNHKFETRKALLETAINEHGVEGLWDQVDSIAAGRT